MTGCRQEKNKKENLRPCRTRTQTSQSRQPSCQGLQSISQYIGFPQHTRPAMQSPCTGDGSLHAPAGSHVPPDCAHWVPPDIVVVVIWDVVTGSVVAGKVVAGRVVDTIVEVVGIVVVVIG